MKNSRSYSYSWTLILPVFLGIFLLFSSNANFAAVKRNIEKNPFSNDSYAKIFEIMLKEKEIDYEGLGNLSRPINKWYIDNIRKQLNGIEKTLPRIEEIKGKELAKEARNIAIALAALPLINDKTLRSKYQALQKRLLQLKSKLKEHGISGITYEMANEGFFTGYSREWKKNEVEQCDP